METHSLFSLIGIHQYNIKITNRSTKLKTSTWLEMLVLVAILQAMFKNA